MIDVQALVEAIDHLDSRLIQLHEIVARQALRINTLEGLVAAVPAYKYPMSPFGGFDVIC